MSPISSRDALDAGFVPSDLPPRAADGGLKLPPAPVRLPIVQPISLCSLGPCRNLHVLTQKVDAQAPLDGGPAPIHVSTVFTCYPSPGIEYDLTSEPVKECNRWAPITVSERDTLEAARRRVTGGELDGLGGDHVAFLKSWEADDEPPRGVYYNLSTDNFYDEDTKKGMGTAFYERWKNHRLSFPHR